MKVKFHEMLSGSKKIVTCAIDTTKRKQSNAQNVKQNVFEKTDMIFPKHSKNKNISGFRQTGETPSPNFDEVI